MKKLIFIISLFITSISFGQVVGLNGNVAYNRGIGVNDGTGDSVLRQQSDRRWTMIHRYDLYGANARGNFIYGNLAGSSQTGATEAMIAIGHNALRLNTIGYNIGVGWQSLYNLDAGSSGNLAIGAYRPMFNQTGGNNNILLGYNIDQAVLSGSNQLNIASAIWGVGTNDVTGSSVSTGNLGFFVTTPTARVHLPAGQAGAGLAPLKFTSGTNLTSAAAGAMEYNGTSLFFSPSTTRLRIVLTDNSIPSNGQLPIGNGTNYTNANLASANGSVTITNGAGTIDLSCLQQTQGTYNPTITGVANLAASVDANFNWKRIGDQFEIWGEVTLDPTTTATLTRVRVSLPIGTSLTNTYELAGTASDDFGTSVRIMGDVANDEAELRFTPTDVTNRIFSVHFKFKWIAP